MVEERFTVDIGREPERVFPFVADLSRYPEWMQLVHQVSSDSPDQDGPDQPSPAWIVTLRAKVGPFARSKRLRMVRTVHQPSSHVRFERMELDGREHSTWVMEATISEADGGSEVAMMLSYSGHLWSGILDAVLDAQVTKATRNLERLSSQPD